MVLGRPGSSGRRAAARAWPEARVRLVEAAVRRVAGVRARRARLERGVGEFSKRSSRAVAGQRARAYSGAARQQRRAAAQLPCSALECPE